MQVTPEMQIAAFKLLVKIAHTQSYMARNALDVDNPGVARMIMRQEQARDKLSLMLAHAGVPAIEDIECQK